LKNVCNLSVRIKFGDFAVVSKYFLYSGASCTLTSKGVGRKISRGATEKKDEKQQKKKKKKNSIDGLWGGGGGGGYGKKGPKNSKKTQKNSTF